MSERTTIDIALLLPTVPDARDACVLRLRNLLRVKKNIETAHLLSEKDTGTGQICIHYDPARFSLGEVRDLARRAGVELDRRFGHLLLKSEPMHARQARTVEFRASQIVGVLDADVSSQITCRQESRACWAERKVFFRNFGDDNL